MLLSFVSWWQWSIVLFYFYAEGGELSWRWLCHHRWHRGCRFHNLRCRRWRQGRRRGGSLVSASVFIVYYMYIYLISRWLALITNKSYCFLFLVSTLNKDFLSYLILSNTSKQPHYWHNYETWSTMHNKNVFGALYINLSPPSAAHVHQWTGSALVQVMAGHRFGAKLSPEPMLTYCQFDP